MSVYRKGPIELRLGDYRDVLADVEPDAVITDPPYSERTHVGMRTGHALTGSGNPYVRAGVDYAGWTEGDARAFAAWCTSRSAGWIVVVEDHVLAPVLLDEMDSLGWYAFAPLPFVELGKQPRLTGDGPASWTCWIAVARPRSARFSGWGSLAGAHVTETNERRAIKGGKPVALMRALVRDYSRPGDLVCDPCAGGATTLIAAALEGRRAIGAELDPETFAKACARIERTALTPPLPGLDVERRPAEQAGLGFEEESA